MAQRLQSSSQVSVINGKFVGLTFVISLIINSAVFADITIPENHPLWKYIQNSALQVTLDESTLKVLDKLNPYEILGLNEDTTDEQLKNNFRALALRFHPDRAGKDGEMYFKKVQGAYDVLSNPDERAYFDQNRETKAQARERRVKEAQRTRHENSRAAGPDFTQSNKNGLLNYLRESFPRQTSAAAFISTVQLIRGVPVFTNAERAAVDEYVQEVLPSWISTSSNFDELVSLSALAKTSANRELAFRKMRGAVGNAQDAYAFLGLAIPLLEKDAETRLVTIGRVLDEFEKKIGGKLVDELVGLFLSDLSHNSSFWNTENRILFEALINRIEAKPHLTNVRSLSVLYESKGLPTEAQSLIANSLLAILTNTPELRRESKSIVPETLKRTSLRHILKTGLLEKCVGMLGRLIRQ